MKEIAQKIIDQWDNHDRFRDFEGAGEPSEVKLARAFLRRGERFTKQVEFSIMLTRFMWSIYRRRPLPDEGHDTHARKTAQEILDRVAKMQAAIDKAREDINWMLNNRQFLNPSVFEYLAEEKFAG